MGEEKRIAVVGTGGWGTTLAVMLASVGRDVILCARSEEEAGTLRASRENLRFLPGILLPDNLTITSSLAQALDSCVLLMLVVPAQTMRENVRLVRPYVHEDTVVLSAAKGLETETGLRMSQVIAEELGREANEAVCVLSGPNLSREIAAGLPSGTVIASAREKVAGFARDLVMTSRFRVYTHDDVTGVELAGALKNIVALGAGSADELGYGENAKAIFMTRGLAEITRLGVAAGANPLTFLGLAGVGDLICTCASPHSRNHYVGQELAKGRSLREVEQSMRTVAEGVDTTRAAMKLASRLNVEMPITEQIFKVLFEGKDIQQAITEMLVRDPKRELEGLEDWVKRLQV